MQTSSCINTTQYEQNESACAAVHERLKSIVREPLRVSHPNRAFLEETPMTDLNSSGVAHALSREFDEAIRCFYQGLCRIGGFVTALSPLVSKVTLRSSLRSHDSVQKGCNVLCDTKLEFDEGWGFFSSFAVGDHLLGPTAGCEDQAAALLYNIGQVHLLQNRDGAALDCFNGVLQLLRHKKGHTLMVPVLHRIAYAQYYREDMKTAIETLTEAMSCFKSGKDSLELAATFNSLGVIYFHLPKPDTSKALSLFARALAMQQALLGPDHTSVATTLNNIGRVHFAAGAFDLALTVYRDALRIRRFQLGNKHPDVAATIYNAGQTLHQKGDLKQALEFYEEFVTISKSIPSSRYIVVVLKNIAIIHHELGNYSRSVALFQEALNIGHSVLGDHADVASILNKLGNLYYELGNADAALQVYRHGLEVEKTVFDLRHPNIAITLSNIGQIYKQRGDFCTALRYYEEALSIQQSSSECPADTQATSLFNVGMIQYQMKRYYQALDTYQVVLGIRRDIHGEDSSEVALTLNSIGLVLFKVGRHKMALEAFQESLRIRKCLPGPKDREIALVLYNIATIQLEVGAEEEALECYRETLKVEKALLGPHHNDVALTLQHIARVHQQRGEIDRALECYQEVLRIQRLNSTEKYDIYIAITLNVIANLEFQLGDIASVVERMSEALRIARLAGHDERDIELAGFDFYLLTRLHPGAAPAA
jgi:tetratricopeptide (TPR) repeat protein